MSCNGRKVFRELLDSKEWPFTFKLKLTKVDNSIDRYAVIGGHPSLEISITDDHTSIIVWFSGLLSIPKPCFEFYDFDVSVAESEKGFYDPYEDELNYYDSIDALYMAHSVMPMLMHLEKSLIDGGGLILQATGDDCIADEAVLFSKKLARLKVAKVLPKLSSDIYAVVDAISPNYERSGLFSDTEHHSQHIASQIVNRTSNFDARQYLRSLIEPGNWTYSFKLQLAKIDTNCHIYTLVGYHPFIKLYVDHESINLRLEFNNLVPLVPNYCEPSFVGDVEPVSSQLGVYNRFVLDEYRQYYATEQELIISENIHETLEYIESKTSGSGGALSLIASSDGSGHGEWTDTDFAIMRCQRAAESPNEFNEIVFFAKAKSPNYLKFSWNWC